jgi:hypothetical protein
MGTSTDAKIVYGIPLREDAISRFDDDRDGELQVDQMTRAQRLSYAVMMGEEAAPGIDLVHHQSCSVTRYFLAISGQTRIARRGRPESLAGMQLDRVPAWDAMLRAAVTEFGLDDETEGEPGWWLASWWSE